MADHSSDLIWQLTRAQSSFIVKRGNTIFSREPYNLTNLHSRKYSGLVNEKAIAIQPAAGGRGIVVSSKSTKNTHNPDKLFRSTTTKKHNRKTYGCVANITAKNSYRPDLRQTAVSRASAILASQKPVKKDPEPRHSTGRRAAKKL